MCSALRLFERRSAPLRRMMPSNPAADIRAGADVGMIDAGGGGGGGDGGGGGGGDADDDGYGAAAEAAFIARMNAPWEAEERERSRDVAEHVIPLIRSGACTELKLISQLPVWDLTFAELMVNCSSL